MMIKVIDDYTEMCQLMSTIQAIDQPIFFVPFFCGLKSRIAEDLVQFIDGKYKTMASPEGRIVIGHCQGGYGAMKIAMKKPGVFGRVGALTPLILSEEGIEPLMPAIWPPNKP